MNDKSDDLKDNIFNLFEQEKEPMTQPEPTTTSNVRPMPKLKKVVSTPLTAEEEALAVEKALNELEAIRNLFLSFQETSSNYAIYGYLEENVRRLAGACKDMVDLIENKIDPRHLRDEASRTRYNKLLDKRNEILRSIMGTNEGKQ